MCFLSENIYDYVNVSQGKVTIPSMDDGEEFALTDVSANKQQREIYILISRVVLIILVKSEFVLICVLFRVSKSDATYFMEPIV